MPKDTLTVTDNRTGKSFEIPIQDGTVRAMDLRRSRHLWMISKMTYDPFTNVYLLRSKITFTDGDAEFSSTKTDRKNWWGKALYPRRPIFILNESFRTGHLNGTGCTISAPHLDSQNIKSLSTGFLSRWHPWECFEHVERYRLLP